MSSNEVKLLAIIVAGTKRKKRTTNILMVSQALNELYHEGGSLSAVSKIVKLSPEMVRQFLKLLELTAEVKISIKNNSIKSVDVAYRISKLVPRDQVVLANSLVKNKLSSKDVRAIVKYKMDNPDLKMQRVISTVMDSKIKKIYVAYLGIDEEIFEQLSLKVNSPQKERMIRTLFEKRIRAPNIVEFSLRGRVVMIKMTLEGMEQMRHEAQRLKIPMAQIANEIVKNYIGGRL